MLPNKYIKHINFMDVCFGVMHQDVWEESVIFSGQWVNQGQVHYHNMNIFETIQIMKKDLPNWSQTNDTNFRKALWHPVKIQ